MRLRIGNRPGHLGPSIAGGPSGQDAPVVSQINPNASRLGGGTAVTITGRNFIVGTVPVVTINGIAATSVVVVNSTTITCLTGVAVTSGLGDVVVTYISQVGTLSNAFTYYTSVITNIVPAFGPLSGSTLVLIYGYNFIEASAIAFDGVAATEVTFIDEQHYSCKTPPHAIGFVNVDIIEPT